MNYLIRLSGLFIMLVLSSFTGMSQTLTSNTNISITKSWTQEPSGYTYPIFISVPEGSVPQNGFPVCILLHGNGSNNLGLVAPGMVQPNGFGSVLPNHILIAPNGYQNTWNICSENSDAPDMEMIDDLVNNLQGYSNVNPNKIRILGTSNGAGLANRIFIENTNPGIDIVCAIVSHLNDYQYHSGDFYKPSGVTDTNSSYCGYDVVANPLTSRKYLSISNTNDSLIPYLGGNSVVGANFLSADTAAFYIATYKGYQGGIITTGTTMGNPVITEYSYLSGDVVHIKGDAGHQANASQKNYITDYFSDFELTTKIGEVDISKIEVYPNPADNIVNIKVDATILNADYSICDISGQTLLFGRIHSDNHKVNITNLSKGVYFLVVERSDLKLAIKVIKE